VILDFDEILNHELTSDGFNAFTIGLGCSCLEISRNVRKGERVSTWRQLAKGSRFQHLRLRGPFCSAILMLSASLQDKRHIKGKRGSRRSNSNSRTISCEPAVFFFQSLRDNFGAQCFSSRFDCGPQDFCIVDRPWPNHSDARHLDPFVAELSQDSGKAHPFFGLCVELQGHGGNQKPPAQC